MQDPYAFACCGTSDSDEPVSALLVPQRTATQSQRRPNEAAQRGVRRNLLATTCLAHTGLYFSDKLNLLAHRSAPLCGWPACLSLAQVYNVDSICLHFDALAPAPAVGRWLF